MRNYFRISKHIALAKHNSINTRPQIKSLISVSHNWRTFDPPTPPCTTPLSRTRAEQVYTVSRKDGRVSLLMVTDSKCILSAERMGEWVCWWSQTISACHMAGWMSVWLSEWMNEWLLKACCFCEGYFSLPLLSISRESNSVLKGCMSSARLLLSRSVCFLWHTESDVSCCLPVIPPAFLVVFASLSLPCFEAFPPQQTQLKVRTLLIMDKKNTDKISSRTLNDLSFLRQNRREWTILMISFVFLLLSCLFLFIN